ncbi:MAG: hypothetical protein IJX18_02530 [Clostridia bacterium]|nr:hypothetical protein [Clostridia bacterium]
MKKGREFSRVYGVLQADKSPIGEGCKELVLQDLAEKFSQYFDLTELPTMEVQEVGGKLQVSVTFQAERVKKFNVLK